MTRHNIKAAPPLTSAYATNIIRWLDAQNSEDSPLTDLESAEVFDLGDMRVVWIGDGRIAHENGGTVG